MPVICGWLNDYSLVCATKNGYFYRYSINDTDNSYKLLSEHTLKDNDYDKQQKTKIYKNIDNKSKDKSKDKSKNKIKTKNKNKNKVNYYQSGHIIGIVRDKNGFIDYVQDGVQYADIKLNVLIKGKHNNNIIGEVQFLLIVMKEFKDKAHNYLIQSHILLFY